MTAHLKIQLIHKLWSHLTPREMFGLSHPGKIQKAGKALINVRREELGHILELERQLHELRWESAFVEPSANRCNSDDLRAANRIKLSDFIETPGEQIIETNILDLGRLMKNAVTLGQYETLERLIRLQKLVLHAERTIQRLDQVDANAAALNRRWFERWKASACEVSNGALQQYWVEILLRELQAPGSMSLRTLEALAFMTLEDASKLGRLAGWLCDDFVFAEALEALADEEAMDVLTWLEESGLLKGVSFGRCHAVLSCDHSSGFSGNISVGRSRLQLTPSERAATMDFPCYRLTGLGRELLALAQPADESQYLDQVTMLLQQRGLVVVCLDSGSTVAAQS